MVKKNQISLGSVSNLGIELKQGGPNESPEDIEDPVVPGHWEGDLLCGSGNSQIATLVERSKRYVLAVNVDRKDTKTVVDALIRTAHQLPNELCKSLTWDRGNEMADFTLGTDIQVYLCDAQSPWQRGSNENITAFYGSTFRRESTWPTFTKQSWMK